MDLKSTERLFVGLQTTDMVKIFSKISKEEWYQNGIMEGMPSPEVENYNFLEWMSCQNYHVQNAIFKGAGYKGFELEKIIMDKEFEWELQVTIRYPFRDVNRAYRIYLNYDPSNLWDSIERAEREIEAIKTSPSLLETEDELKIKAQQEKIKYYMEEIEKKTESSESIIFDVTGKKAEFPFGAVKLYASVPSFFVQKVIENRSDLRGYALRLQEI
ncbi:MAG: hypothetical protein WCJ84_00535 [Candidatus Peregrinibacteria bacterium]